MAQTGMVVFVNGVQSVGKVGSTHQFLKASSVLGGGLFLDWPEYTRSAPAF